MEREKRERKKENHLDVVRFSIEEDSKFAYIAKLILRTTLLYNHIRIYTISKCLMNLIMHSIIYQLNQSV